MVTAADADAALAADVVPGRAGGAPQLREMLDRAEERVPVEEVVGGKASDGDALRVGGLDRGIRTVIPNEANRTDPWPFDEAVYRERDRVERLLAKLKQFRRVATRYEKLKVTVLGMVHLALGFIRLRKSVNVNRP